jgi:hypothetical protein
MSFFCSREAVPKLQFWNSLKGEVKKMKAVIPAILAQNSAI